MISWERNKVWHWNFVHHWWSIKYGKFIWKNHAENVHQRLAPDPFLLNNPKQPLHAINKIFWKRIIKKSLSVWESPWHEDYLLIRRRSPDWSFQVTMFLWYTPIWGSRSQQFLRYPNRVTRSVSKEWKRCEQAWNLFYYYKFEKCFLMVFFSLIHIKDT